MTLPYAAQIERNVVLSALIDLRDRDRTAGRRLFGMLAALEEIALLAAERGDGVPGQVDDERAHRDTFARIAARLGGFDPVPESIINLRNYLLELSGAASLVALNVVSEVWLANVFHHVGPARAEWAPLFAAIEAEERRHSHEALARARIDGPEGQKVLHFLEELLWRVTVDPAFLWPIAWFTGIPGVARMGQRAKFLHAAACGRLGLRPGEFSREIARCGTEALASAEPLKLALTPGQAGAFAYGVRPIGTRLRVRWRHGRGAREIEARVMLAVGAALAGKAGIQWNRTVVESRAEMFWARDVMVGTRRVHSPGNLTTLYLHEPALYDSGWEGVSTALSLQARRLRDLPFVGPPARDRELEELAPAPRAAATVTCVVPFFPPGAQGVSSLVPHEGATWSVCATSLERGWLGRCYLDLWIEADHRAHDGKALGEFAGTVFAQLWG